MSNPSTVAASTRSPFALGRQLPPPAPVAPALPSDPVQVDGMWEVYAPGADRVVIASAPTVEEARALLDLLLG